MRITFKYVGQGDCILIEWEQDGQRKIGIVDCNAHGPSNVVIRHLQTTGYGEIDFIILSHPHRDHYSGFTALLQYCKDSNVRILRFIHTCKNVHAFLSSFFIPIEDRSTLDQVFVSTHALRKIGLLQARFEVNQHFVAELGNGLRMRFLAPSTEEYDSYIESLYQDAELHPRRPNENLLSTIIILEENDWYILLTSDAERAVLKRIGQRNLRHDWRPMRLAQVPHHGSLANYSSGFWKNRRHDPGTPVAISVGPNPHGHPSPEVIRRLTSLRFDVQTTWDPPEHGIRSDVHADLALDVVSKARRHSSYGQDLVFDLLSDNDI